MTIKKIIENIQIIIFLLLVLFMVGIVLFTLSSLGGAINSNDRDFYCGENPEKCR